ncbi:major facilitator superfamily protein [Sphingobium sp. SYK-6]|nr:major facilitator superfamily protein [Sphingobium sp. SYK-6]
MATLGATESRSGNVLILTLLVGACQMVVTMDLVTMGILLPSIGDEYPVGRALLSGLVSFSALTFASMLLIGGRLSDLAGQRSCFAIGLLLAAAGAVVSALAPSFILLLAGRLFFGVGAAILVPANFSLINTVIPEGPQRRRAYGIFGMAQGLALFIGPGLGGALATAFGWRSVFVANAVFMIALLVLSRVLVPDRIVSARRPFDIAGAVSFVPAVLLLVIAITSGSGLVPGVTERLVLGIAGCGLMALFLRIQKRVDSPLLPLDIFAYPRVKSGLIGMMAVMAASAALFILPSLVMQRGMGWSAAQSGVGMLPHAVTVVCAGQAIGWLMGRFTLSHNVLTGFALLILGTFINGWMFPGGGYLFNVMIPMILGAAGSIFAVIMLTAVITGPHPPHQQGVIAAVTFTSQQIGIAIGSVALLSLAEGEGTPLASLNRAFLAASMIALCGLLATLARRDVKAGGTEFKKERMMWDLFGTEHGKAGWTSYAILWLRIAFGAHALLSGINYFHPLVPPAPIGVSPAGPFVMEMDHIGLFGLIKIVEILVGICLILNIYVPLVLVLEMPTTMSIFYLNTFVDGAPRQLYTGPRELFYNLILIAAYFAYFRPLLTAGAHFTPIWRGGRDSAGRDPVTGSVEGEARP